MNYLLMASCLAAVVVFVVVRPRWRQIGPSLLDAYLIGLCLFAVGAFFVWIEGLANSEAVMRIAISAAISGILGASLCSYLFAGRVAKLNFFGDARRFCATPNDHFMISLGLLVSSLASLLFVVAVFSHEHIRSLLLDALFRGARTLNEARTIVSSGAEGYFAPGYFKQFRDISIPILCVAAILCGGTYRRRGLLFATFTVAVVSGFISGQRLVILLYFLCFGAAFLIDRFSLRQRFSSLPVAVCLLLVLVGVVGLMSNMLGRSDAVLSPPVEAQQQKEWRAVIEAEQRKQEAALQKDTLQKETAGDKEAAAPPSPAGPPTEPSPQERTEAEASAPQVSEPPKEILAPPFSSMVPGFLMPAVALAHRAVIAVPRENTVSFYYWSRHKHAFGAGWMTDLAAIRPGTQTQLANELFTLNWGGGAGTVLGDSVLGLADDVYYNAGWFGVILVPALYALLFLLLDIALTASRSPLTSAAKIFIFFTIPLMYSPFLFVLHGGVVVVGILCYVRLLQRGAFSFIGFLSQTEQPTH